MLCSAHILTCILQTVDELEWVARLCPHLVDLRGVSVGVLDEREKHAQVNIFCNKTKEIINKYGIFFI